MLLLMRQRLLSRAMQEPGAAGGHGAQARGRAGGKARVQALLLSSRRRGLEAGMAVIGCITRRRGPMQVRKSCTEALQSTGLPVSRFCEAYADETRAHTTATSNVTSCERCSVEVAIGCKTVQELGLRVQAA